MVIKVYGRGESGRDGNARCESKERQGEKRRIKKKKKQEKSRSEKNAQLNKRP